MESANEKSFILYSLNTPSTFIRRSVRLKKFVRYADTLM